MPPKTWNIGDVRKLSVFFFRFRTTMKRLQLIEKRARSLRTPICIIRIIIIRVCRATTAVHGDKYRDNYYYHRCHYGRDDGRVCRGPTTSGGGHRRSDFPMSDRHRTYTLTDVHTRIYDRRCTYATTIECRWRAAVTRTR